MQSRPLRPWEQAAHLHVLDWAHSTARIRLQAAGATQVKAGARAVAKTPAGHLTLPALEAAMVHELSGLYALGHMTVRSELDHQHTGMAMPVGLSALTDPASRLLAVTAPPADPQNLRARARLIAESTAHHISQAIHRAHLQGITQRRQLRQIGVDAGHGALGQAASHHAGGVINAGRHAAATAPPGREILGARYTSVLDRNSCAACIAADDGVLRALDDPGLIHPPNPACAGGDRCRCILVYQLAAEGQPLAAA